LTGWGRAIIMVMMKELFENLDAMLFDLDGTLVETNIDFPLMKREMLRMASEKGMPPDMLGTLDILGIVSRVEEYLHFDSRDDEAAGYKAEAFQVLEEIELRHSAHTKEIAFARELLDELRSRSIKIGIVTRNCRSASEMSLEITDLKPDVMLCREDVKQTKPHPEQLLTALRLLGTGSDNSIMVGDHIMDIKAGKAAGMKTIGVLLAERPGDFFDEVAPDAVVESLKDIIDALIDYHS
jgi:HAD superfamily hydrolase (TIGR01509 family)